MNEIGIYVHIPYCASKCKYCSFTSSVNNKTEEQYVSALINEIKSKRTGELVTSVYFGGGTPSVLKNGQINRILSSIRDNYSISDDCEITVEANPESATDEFLDECKLSEVNRLSFGLQCADNEILKKIGRLHTVEQFTEAVNGAKNRGFDNISGDIIIGLEGENDKTVIDSLVLLDSLKIDHVSVYSLSVEKGCIMYTEKYRPDEDLMADRYDLCCEFLKNAGYERYEISNFARNGKVSRHNNKYWTGVDYLGFGVAAHSLRNGVRSENTSSINKYISGVSTVNEILLTKTDYIEEFIMLGLRLKSGISLSKYYKKFGERLEEKKAAEIKKLLGSGIIEIVGDYLRATDKGAYVLNYIITELI